MFNASAHSGLSFIETYTNDPSYPRTLELVDGAARRRVPRSNAAVLLSSLPADPARSTRCAEKGLLRTEGEYWTIEYGGKALRLKDSKGLSYLARLLCAPGTDFHALDLAGNSTGYSMWREAATPLPRKDEELASAGIHVGGLGDAGVVLDEPAKAAYRLRLAELRAEVEEAKELDQCERAERAEGEIDALTAELARAVGIGGRDRRMASAAERARQSVSRALKTVVQKIAEYDPVLGVLFSRSIKTGTFCSYTLDPSSPIAWEFGITRHDITSPPPEQPPPSGSAERPRAYAETTPGEFPFSQLSSAHRTPFVGRKAERERLRALIDHALTGQGSLVMLGGGAGVGKTRLALEMAQEAARQGFRCFVGRCYEREEPYPYLPFTEMIETALAQIPSLEECRRALGDNAAELAQIAPRLRRLFPDIPASLELPASQVRRYLFQSLAEVLARAACRVPLFLILDDLQWADESTLALVHFLANRVGSFPVVIVAIYRDSEVEDNPALVRTLEELLRIGLRPLKLHGLSYEAVARLLQELSQQEPPASLVQVIFAETQGNPFFVEEVYKHLAEEGKLFDAAGQFRADLIIDEVDVPDNVRLVLGRRLARLDEPVKQVLSAAAVIGRHFSFPLLQALLEPIDVDKLLTALEEAQRRGLVESSTEGPEAPFTFTHELVRQTLLAGLSLPRRQRLHLQVAEALERAHVGAVHERGEIAHHLVKAGSLADTQRVVQYLMLAGQHALEAAAYEDALHQFHSALAHQDALDARQRAELLKHVARAERGLEKVG